MRQYQTAVSASEQTTHDASNWATVVTLTADVEDGKTYWLFASGYSSSTFTTDTQFVRFRDATAGATLSGDPAEVISPASGAREEWPFLASFTASADGTNEFRIEHKCRSGSGATAGLNSFGRITIVEASADDEYVEALTETSAYSGTSYASVASKAPFTPASAGDYAILATFEGNGSTAGRYGSRLVINGSTVGEAVPDNFSSGRWFPFGMAGFATGVSSAQTYELDHRTTNGSASVKTRSLRILALRVGADEEMFADGQASDTNATSTPEDNAAAAGTAAGGDYLVVGSHTIFSANSALFLYSQLAAGGSAISPEINTKIAASSWRSNYCAFGLDVGASAGSRTWSTQFRNDDNSSTVSTSLGVVWAFSVAQPASGEDLDAEGASTGSGTAAGSAGATRPAASGSTGSGMATAAPGRTRSASGASTGTGTAAAAAARARAAQGASEGSGAATAQAEASRPVAAATAGAGTAAGSAGASRPVAAGAAGSSILAGSAGTSRAAQAAPAGSGILASTAGAARPARAASTGSGTLAGNLSSASEVSAIAASSGSGITAGSANAARPAAAASAGAGSATIIAFRARAAAGSAISGGTGSGTVSVLRSAVGHSTGHGTGSATAAGATLAEIYRDLDAAALVRSADARALIRDLDLEDEAA